MHLIKWCITHGCCRGGPERRVGLQDFRKIAQSLPHRSTAEVVRHYYKVQKLDEFALVRRKQQLKKRRIKTEENKDRNTTFLGVNTAALPAPPPRRGAFFQKFN